MKKDDPDQLDLFDIPTAPNGGRDERPAPIIGGTVHRFPLARRRRKITSVARIFEQRKTEDSKRRYWATVTADLAREMRRHGAETAEVKRQLEAFRLAVGDELSRQQAPATGPRGAA